MIPDGKTEPPTRRLSCVVDADAGAAGDLVRPDRHSGRQHQVTGQEGGTVEGPITIDPSSGSGSFTTVDIDEPTIYTMLCFDLKASPVIATAVVNILPVYEEF